MNKKGQLASNPNLYPNPSTPKLLNPPTPKFLNPPNSQNLSRRSQNPKMHETAPARFQQAALGQSQAQTVLLKTRASGRYWRDFCRPFGLRFWVYHRKRDIYYMDGVLFLQELRSWIESGSFSMSMRRVAYIAYSNLSSEAYRSLSLMAILIAPLIVSLWQL